MLLCWNVGYFIKSIFANQNKISAYSRALYEAFKDRAEQYIELYKALASKGTR